MYWSVLSSCTNFSVKTVQPIRLDIKWLIKSYRSGNLWSNSHKPATTVIDAIIITIISGSTMVKLGLVVISAIFCLVAIEALLAHRRQGNDTSISQDLEEVKSKCTPGKFYKRGCKRCFCNDKQKPICGKIEDCKLANKFPTKPKFLQDSLPELYELPMLLHQSSNCTPGVVYRVDCDACVCLANKNLMCNDILCPSYYDINRIVAKEMSGSTCEVGINKTNECISCPCIKGVLKCEALFDCIPSGRRGLQSKPLDLDAKKKSPCVKGMVYKRACNRCYCQKDNSLRCTLMRCLKHTEVQRLKKLRSQLEREGL
ncbi:uncharacterized protein LOC125238039 isoform X2 [Leguminivora glycinivorella]|uniref:uncharacterized protein LOC125238039 isoform X2 n=1 Tax=Leguminivora glycinivorella TaxID=1035111 RepID=UPI00200F9E92|nr:uncharacterized protein LOC125238039 isoform X2 [Leguminivora glycinivorella]